MDKSCKCYRCKKEVTKLVTFQNHGICEKCLNELSKIQNHLNNIRQSVKDTEAMYIMTNSEKFKQVFGFSPNIEEDSTLRPAYCPFDEKGHFNPKECRFWNEKEHCDCLKFWDKEYQEPNKQLLS